MKPILIIVFTSLSIYGFSQATLTLTDCYNAAISASPISKDPALYKQISDIKQKNINALWKPKVDFNAQATYQSDVTQLPNFSIPSPQGPMNIDMPTLQKDMYKTTLDVQQLFFDGGLTKNQHVIESLTSVIDSQQVVVELTKIKSQINQYYFSILIIHENIKLLNNVKKQLVERIRVVESGVKNGILKASSLQILQAEQLKTEQQIIELESLKNSSYKGLSIVLNKEISSTTDLTIPDFNVVFNADIKRPEYVLFKTQSSKIDAFGKISKAERMPRLVGFAQVGYGRPGLNMLNSKFDSFYLVGASFKWNVWDWNKSNRDRQILDIQKNLIDSKKQILDQNLNLLLSKEQTDISKYEELINKDKEIITLRESITKSAVSQLENGAITSTDYLVELTAETQARVTLETHKIQLIQAKVNYLTIKGDL